ncbi:homoprotocatechuate degradation operon regulator HpaR [Pokkaliibacter plantistimulans]|uniref:Homoprotocatechuate degradation operon regulator HpaR n=1 Tax=Proteobacteria bacterium 228 TaxID=2083153 RepID=A0A2S5KHE0_9PROT|nr:homoprotocatechuate degradation operon regulator HpaR [Pokkaliibacter plantistimulans]PPC73919.1 homoprotocatechuate degradation operon regulator HpaR [Pokkaliibacter plantistimulans]
MRKFDDSLPLKLLKAREAAMSFFRPFLQEHNITEQQWRILRALFEHEELEAKQLARTCCILSPSLTGIISRLEAQGYIKRRKGEDDQRRVLLSMTDEARAFFDNLSPEVESRYKQLTDRLGQEKLQQLHELLNEVIELRQAE